MGSLAMWSAVAGAGQGLGQGLQLQSREKDNERDRQHAARLAQLKIKADNDRSLEERKLQRELNEAQIDATKENTKVIQDAYTARNDANIAATLGEGEADRKLTREVESARREQQDKILKQQQEHDEAMRTMEMKYGMDVATVKALIEQKKEDLKAMRERWDVKTEIDESMGPTQGEYKTILVDNQGLNTFTREGDRFVLQNWDVVGADKDGESVKRSSDDVIALLAEQKGMNPQEFIMDQESKLMRNIGNEEAMLRFANIFGYLPATYVSLMRGAALGSLP